MTNGTATSCVESAFVVSLPPEAGAVAQGGPGMSHLKDRMQSVWALYVFLQFVAELPNSFPFRLLLHLGLRKIYIGVHTLRTLP